MNSLRRLRFRWRLGMPLLASWLCALPLFAKEAVKPEDLCEPGTACYAQLESIGEVAQKGSEIARQNEVTQRAGFGFGAKASELAERLAALQRRIENGESTLAQIQSHAQQVERFAAMLDSLPRNYRASWEPLRAQVRDIADQIRSLQAGVPLSAKTMSAMTADLRGASDALLALSVSELANLGSQVAGESRDPFSGKVGKAGPQLDYGRRLREYYGDEATTEYAYAIVTVPDPRVPRNARNFDLIVEAIHAAMADQGYLFDRYRFPWDEPGPTDRGLPSADDVAVRLECAARMAAKGAPGNANANIDMEAALNWAIDQYCGGARVSRYGLQRTLPAARDWKKFGEYVKHRSAEAERNPCGGCASAEANDGKRDDGNECKGPSEPAYPWIPVDACQRKAVSPCRSRNSVESIASATNGGCAPTSQRAPNERAILEKFASWVSTEDSTASISAPVGGADYGLMTYRRDEWRCADPLASDGFKPCSEASNVTHALSVKAIYLVADRQTLGVAGSPLIDAWVALERDRDAPATVNQHVPVLGPVTSGSVGSLIPSLDVVRKAAGKAGMTRIFDIRTPTATAKTNTGLPLALDGGRVGKATTRPGPCPSDPPPPVSASGIFTFGALAVSDETKLCDLRAKLDKTTVAFLIEDSVWGRELAKTANDEKMFGNAGFTFFPPNIREVRIGEEPRRAVSIAPDFLAAFRFGPELRLDADVGSEFTPKYAQQTTARTLERGLIQTLRKLESDQRHPSAIVIAATDVRDQLFMARLVRSRMGDPQLVFFGADELIAHPDFIDATRGAWLIASAPLTTARRARGDLVASGRAGADSARHTREDPAASVCTGADFDEGRHLATDEAALYYRAVAGWTDGGGWLGLRECRPSWYVATRNGLESVSNSGTHFPGPIVDDGNSEWRAGLSLFAGLLAVTGLWSVRTNDLRRAWETLPAAGPPKDYESRSWFRRWRWRATQLAHEATAGLVWILGKSRWVAGSTTVATALVLALLLCCARYAPWDSGLNAAVAAAFLLAVAIVVLLVRCTCGRMRALMRDWSAGYGAVDSRLTRSVSVSLCMVLFALGIALLLLLLPPVWHGTRFFSFQHGLGYWSGIAVHPMAICATLLGAWCSAMAYTALEHARDYRAALMAGHDFEDLREEWVGHAELPIVATPLAALPDPKPLSDLPLTPGLALLRRIRQFCGTEIAFVRMYLGLAMLAPIVSIAMIWLTPVPAQNAFLAINLALLVIAALLAQTAVLRLEKDKVLSQAFCRLDDGIRVGPMLLTYLVIPVAVIAFGIYLAMLPGVRESSGNAMIPLIGSLFGH